jgi:hypothetical protein
VNQNQGRKRKSKFKLTKKSMKAAWKISVIFGLIKLEKKHHRRNKKRLATLSKTNLTLGLLYEI